MRYVLKDKILSLGGDLTIQDAHGHQLYLVDGKLISIGRRFEVKDQEGDEVAVIQQRLISLLPAFEIRLKDGVSVTMSKRLSVFVDRLKIDVPGRDDLYVHGDLLHHEYSFERGGHEVARVSKRWISLVDAYGVDIDEGQNDLLILCCAVVIDELLDREREDD